MDDIDQKIIHILQYNARMPIKNIGEEIGLSAPAVADRIRKLEKNGIITEYTAIIDPKKIGKTLSALINVSMRASHHKEFFEILKNNKNIIECHHVTGSYCMILKAHFNNISELESLINKIQKFGETSTSIILSSPLIRKEIIQ